MKKLLAIGSLSVLVIILIFTSCGTENQLTHQDVRPHEPWIFRSVLDGQPRSITFALDNDLWLAYNTSTGAVYKAWDGVVNFEGAVYNSIHGPQPITYGKAYFVNEYKEPWIVKKGDQDQEYTYSYRGHRRTDNHGAILHELMLKDGSRVVFDESPEVIYNASGRLGLKRMFTIIEKPTDVNVGLRVNLNHLVVASDVITNGTWTVANSDTKKVQNRSYLAVDGTLMLQDGETEFLTLLANKAMIANDNDPKEGLSVNALHPGANLIAQADCQTCHNERVKTVGPAYVDIAKRYADTKDNITLLSNKIIKGGSGVWGSQMMTPHPDLTMPTTSRMVKYILSLDDPAGMNQNEQKEIIKLTGIPKDSVNSDLVPGSVVRIYNIKDGTSRVPDETKLGPAEEAGILANFDNLDGGDFVGWKDQFALYGSGLLEIDEDKEVSFRLWSDDGSKLYINDQLIIDHDGYHGTSMKEAKVKMTKGMHHFDIGFFQGGGGQFLSFNWKPEGADIWAIVPPTVINHLKSQQTQFDIKNNKLAMSVANKIPGDKFPLLDVHPSFDVKTALPAGFNPKVGGLDFLSDGTVALSTWDSEGAVYLVKNTETGDPSQMSVEKIANGLAEPLGLKVVDDEIYIMQKQEMTKLVDTDGDGQIDEYLALCDDWGVTNNFHEFGFGLEYKDGHFYAALATGILPGGASMPNQHPHRGSVIKVNKETGEFSIVANGLRTPNGIGIGVDGELFVCDNEGDWLPSSKVNHIREGAWYGQRSVDFEGTEGKQMDMPMVWLPHFEIGNSPSTPSYLDKGPYKGQMIHCEVTHGGVKRVFVEKVNGQYQGCVFRFIQGLQAGVNRIAWSPDGALYTGEIGDSGNWGQNGKAKFGLERLEYNEKSAFEMLAVRAKSDGIEIEFTEPLQEGDGWNPDDYLIKQWYYLPTVDYGGPKMNEQELDIKSVNVSADRKKVFLELNGMKKEHVVYVLLQNHFVSAQNQELWSTEAWYTMNNIPENEPGIKTKVGNNIVGNNQLNNVEKKQGWKLLFDGETLDGWHKFKHDGTDDCKWRVTDGTMHYSASHDGEWGDIATNDEFENYELKLEWKISNCGNSGIIYHVQESDTHNASWKTGPEMQILDNTCHPDTKYVTHQAGDLYDMIACKFKTVKPAGEWNNVMIRSIDSQMQFWLNGYKVVEFTMHDDSWDEMVKNSKFNGERDPEMIDFGKFKKGKIALQDHGDDVWFRNVKIREL